MRKEIVNLQVWVLAVGLLILLAKFAAWFITRSNTVLSDALESVVNVVAGGFTLYSLVLSGKPEDSNHPYGHGKIEFIAAGVEGSLIIMAGLLIIIESITSLLYPHPIGQLNTGLLVATVAGLLNFFMGMLLERKGKKYNTLALVAGGKHLKSDAWSTLGLVIGLGLIYFTGLLWLDSAIAILFGLIIGVTGIQIVRGSVAGMMDEADYELLKQVLGILNQHRRPNWIDIHNLRIIKYGTKLHIDAHLTLPWYLQLKESNREVEYLSELIDRNFETSVELFVHVDPCLPENCTMCTDNDCQAQQLPLVARQPWTLENVLSSEQQVAGHG